MTAIGAGAAAAIATGTITGSTLVTQGADARALFLPTNFFGADAAAVVRNTILSGGLGAWDAVVSDNDASVATGASLDIAASTYGAGRLRTIGTAAQVTEGAGTVTTVSPLLAGLPGGLDRHRCAARPRSTPGPPRACRRRPTSTAIRASSAPLDIGADEYLPPPLATIQTIVVDDTDAAISGLVTPRGSDTNWRVEVGPTTAYGATVFGATVIAKSVASQSVTAPIGGLRPATLYHARLVAVSAKGTTFGPDATFRTLAAPGPAITWRVPR